MPRPGHSSNVSALASARFVTIPSARIDRSTVNAIETKIKHGVWIEGQNCAASKKRVISSNSTN